MGVEAGWYPDPKNPESERLWDGGAWVSWTRPQKAGRKESEPAGWMPDPTNTHIERLWAGDQWTDYKRPMSDGSLDDGAAAVDEADPVWAFEAVGGSGTASKPQSLAPPQPGEESESERVGWIITFVIPVLLIATPLQVATVAGILGLISVVALIVSLVKGKYLLAIATAVVYSVATLAIASQRDGGDPIPILPTWIAYFLLMMGAWGGSKPRSLWARLMSPS